jgi:DNA-binding LytR/AlgR family response regulator
MSKLNILIVENPNDVEIDLKDRLTTFGFNVIGQLTSPENVIDFIEKNEVDIIISDDFSKHKKNGVQLANEVVKNYHIPVVFLVSDEKTLDFEKSLASSLLTKPANDFELINNIFMAHNSSKINRFEIQDQDEFSSKYLFVRADYKINKIRLSDIYYIESKKDYVNIHTSNNVFTVHSSMKEIDKNLNNPLLHRIHRSYIINIDKILSIKYPDLVIEDKMKTLSIGGLYRKSLFNKLNIL